MLAGLDLVSTEFLATLGTITILAWIGLVALRLALHVRWRWIAAALLVPLTLTVAMAADSVNAYFDYLPTTADVVNAAGGDREWPTLTHLEGLSPAVAATVYPHGAITRMRLPADPANGFDSTMAIAYLPLQYLESSTARLPVVYLFHGSPGKPSDWFHGGRADLAGLRTAGLGAPAIIVAPQMSSRWTDDPECVNGVHEKVESHLIDSIVPTIDTSLRTVANRDGRTFAGMSAGGYCALNLGLRHRDLVSSIVDMSGFTMPTHTGGMTRLFGDDRATAQMLTEQNSPSVYVPKMAPGPPMRIWMDCGTSDHEVLKQMQAIEPELTAQGFTVHVQTRPGSHTYHVWRPALFEALPWVLLPA
jgi:enterochelin esterase-like enzyme